MNGPSESTKKAVHQVQFLRGAFIGSYAQVEFLLADICVKAWLRPEYQQLSRKFPYQAESRVKAANALFESPGPLSKYQAEVQGLFEQLLRFEEIRDFFAHGLLRINKAEEEFSAIILMYRPAKAGLQVGTLEFSLRQMADASADIVRFAHQFVLLFRRIYSEQALVFPPEVQG